MFVEVILSCIGLAGASAAAAIWCAVKSYTDGTILDRPSPTPAPVTPAPPTGPTDDDREMKLFLDTGAWWLDPNRWGDDPDWKSRIPGPARMPRKGPELASNKLPCPKCGSKRVTIMAEYGGVAAEWQCDNCRLTFTKATRVKRQPISPVKEAQALVARIEAGLTDMERERTRPQYVEDMPPPPGDAVWGVRR